MRGWITFLAVHWRLLTEGYYANLKERAFKVLGCLDKIMRDKIVSHRFVLIRVKRCEMKKESGCRLIWSPLSYPSL